MQQPAPHRFNKRPGFSDQAITKELNTMKQLYLLQWIFLVMSTVNLNAQAYHPMPQSEAQWDITRCWYFYPGGWHDEYSVRMDGSDTTLNDKVYKKMDFVTHHAPGTEFDSVYTHFLGGMREENKQVFFFSEYLCLDTISRMLYDFNPVDPGDTIFTQVLTNGLTQFIPHIVLSIDSVLVGGEFHRRIYVRDETEVFSEYWIEGVGSTQGIIYPSYWLLTDNSYDLNCFYDSDQLHYTNPNPMYLFCSFPFPDIQCESTTSSTPPVSDAALFKIYPNPVSDILNIETTNDVITVDFFNGWGKNIMACNFSNQLDVSGLPSGFYFLQFKGRNQNCIGTIKVVKI